jgi:hypothetical protein
VDDVAEFEDEDDDVLGLIGGRAQPTSSVTKKTGNKNCLPE